MTNIRRMGETGTVPAVPPLWAGKEPGSYEAEANLIATVVDGEEVYKA